MNRERSRNLTFRRAFRSLPRRTTEQTAALLTTLLFAVTIGVLVTEIAAQIEGIVDKTVPGVASECLLTHTPRNAISNGSCDLGANGAQHVRERVETIVDSRIESFDQRLPMLSHLALATTLILLSALGYYGSRRRPKLAAWFFNKTLLQTTIDMTLVGLYYVLVEFTDSTPDRASAAPEAFLIAIVFSLYATWDIISYRIEKDEYAQLALRKVPQEDVDFGYRRYVSLGLAVGLTILGLAYGHLGNFSAVDSSRSAVVIIDLVLILLVVAFRLVTTLGDKSIHYQGEYAESTGDTAETKRKLCSLRPVRCEHEHTCNICRGIASDVNICELMEMLPELDLHAMMLIRCVALQERKRRCCRDACDNGHNAPKKDGTDISQTSHLWRHAFAAGLGEHHEDHFGAYFEAADSECRSNDTECTTELSQKTCGSNDLAPVDGEDNAASDDVCGNSETKTDEKPSYQFCDPSQLTRVKLTPFGQYICGIITKDSRASAKHRCQCCPCRDCCCQPACMTDPDAQHPAQVTGPRSTVQQTRDSGDQ